MIFFKKKHSKEVAKNIFDYFKFEATNDGAWLMGDWKDKDFSTWLAFVHHTIQGILKMKPITKNGTFVENYVNITMYLGGQRVEVAIIKDGGKSPIELLEELKQRTKP
jgi:hypothetical protein